MLSQADPLSHMPCRSVRPIMVEQFNVNWGKVFSFLFPDGNILHGSWTSYAVIAFVFAIFIELGTQLLYLLVRVSSCLQRGPNTLYRVCLYALQLPFEGA